MQSFDQAKVREWIKGLERIDRYIVLLHYVDELTAKEISLVLETPLLHVESMVIRARREVERILDTTTGPAEAAVSMDVEEVGELRAIA